MLSSCLCRGRTTTFRFSSSLLRKCLSRTGSILGQNPCSLTSRVNQSTGLQPSKLKDSSLLRFASAQRVTTRRTSSCQFCRPETTRNSLPQRPRPPSSSSTSPPDTSLRSDTLISRFIHYLHAMIQFCERPVVRKYLSPLARALALLLLLREHPPAPWPVFALLLLLLCCPPAPPFISRIITVLLLVLPEVEASALLVSCTLDLADLTPLTLIAVALLRLIGWGLSMVFVAGAIAVYSFKRNLAAEWVRTQRRKNYLDHEVAKYSAVGRAKEEGMAGFSSEEEEELLRIAMRAGK